MESDEIIRAKTLPHMIAELWCGLARPRRRQFVLLIVFMILASLVEMISVGAILPFLSVLTAPEKVFRHSVAQPLIQFLDIDSAQQLLLPIAIGFCAAVILAGGVRLLLLYATTRYSYAVGADLSSEVYRRTLYQPYRIHISRNSSEVINGITGKTAMTIGSVLMPLLTLISSAILLLGILVALFMVDLRIASIACAAFGFIYWLILRLTRQSLQRNSECIARESTQVVKALQEGLGGIRDVLIDGSQEAYCRIFVEADRPIRGAQGHNTFVSASPRYVIETIGIVLVAGLAYSMSLRDGGLATAVPVLGALALGAQRLLPILQQGYSSLTIIRGAEASLSDILVLLNQPLPPHAGKQAGPPVVFQREIHLKDVSFRYAPEGPWVLRHLDLRLERGARIGFVGTTGSGKSTLLDIVMGLLEPTEGMLTVDGQSITAQNQPAWQAHISHVPQSIFLADCSIAENIAFGLSKSEIDYPRVRAAARQAQIADAIDGWEMGYQTIVGERGVRLSGGQRQRIGIARALYKKSAVIIFDEATSALDQETERVVMESIQGLGRDLTILIIAHRLTTLKSCDTIVELSNGDVKCVGTYDQLIKIE